MCVEMKLDDKELQKMFAEIKKRSGPEFVHFWKMFHAYMKVRTDLMFEKLEHGGSFRGVKWAPFAGPWAYRLPTKKKKIFRKSSSRSGAKTEVTIRVYTKVPSGKAKLMQRTGRLRKRAATRVFKKSKSSFSFGSTVKYASAQNKMRKFLFFEAPKDINVARDMMAKYILGTD